MGGVGRGQRGEGIIGHMDTNEGGGWRWGREGGVDGVGWRDGEKRHTTVIEEQ